MTVDKSALPNDREATDNLWDAIYTQRAIRYFQADRKVPRELLAQVVEAGSKAPSGSNLQPWVFVVVDDDAQRLPISQALRAVYDNADQLRAMIDQGAKSEDKSQRLMLKGAKEFFSNLERAPALIVPCLYKLASPTPDPGSLEAGSSIYGAVQNMMLSARALGLGTVMTTAHSLIETALRETLRIPDDAYPVALIPIGYPDANFGPTTRKGLDEILAWNGWSV
jgi:nitroreductase